MARLIDAIQGHKDKWQQLYSAVSAGRLPQSLIFAGLSGIGKKQVAMALAQAMVCESKARPCGECGPCLRLEKRQSESLCLFGQEGEALKIEQAREILDFLSLQQLGKARIVIIDEAQLMTPQAANALLKIVEEPPPNSYFIFITSNSSALLPTIRSRSQTLRFQQLSKVELKKIVSAPDWILEAAQGRVTVTESLNRPEINEMRAKVLSLLSDFVSGAISDVQAQLKNILADKESALFAVLNWQQIIRDARLKRLGDSHFIHADQSQLLQSLSQFSEATLDQMGEGLLQVEKDLQTNFDRQLSFEVFLNSARRWRQAESQL